MLMRPAREFVGVGAVEGELVLRAADAVFDGQVLYGLHEEEDALAFRQPLFKTKDDFRRRGPLIVRLQGDQYAPAVKCCVGAVNADKRRQALDRGILEDSLGQRLLTLRHGFKGN